MAGRADEIELLFKEKLAKNAKLLETWRARRVVASLLHWWPSSTWLGGFSRPGRRDRTHTPAACGHLRGTR